MNIRKMPLSQEELGIYLSCVDGGLQYNLPFIVDLKGRTAKEVQTAIEAVFRSHPSLFTILSKGHDGTIIKEIVPSPISIKSVNKISAKDWAREFELIGHPLYRFELEEGKGGSRLFADFHHILIDGTSIRLFLDDLETALEGKLGHKVERMAFSRGKEEEDQRNDSVLYERDKAFFIKTFGSIDSESLPVLDKKDPIKSYRRMFFPLSLSPLEVGKYRKKHLIHTSAFFLGVYSKAISLYSGNDDAFFLTVNNGRSQKEQDALGMFVRTYPIYTSVPMSGDIPTFLSLINLEQEEIKGHQAYSLEELVRDSGANPSSLFSYQGDDFYKNGFLKADPIEVKDGISDFSVELFRTEDDGYSLAVSYRNDLFEETTISSFAASFDIIAREFLIKKDLGDIDVLSQADKDSLMLFHKNHLVDFDSSISVVDLFERAAEKDPSHPSIVFKDHSLSYGEVKAYSDAIAEEILQKGHKKGEIAAILLPRDECTPVVALGILKAGLAYQPLDQTYPDDRLSFMLEDSGAKLLFTTPSLLKRIPGYHNETIMEEDLPKLKSNGVRLPKAEGNDLFILLYTSGSTGIPKGVMLEHRGLSYYCQWFMKHFGLDGSNRISSYASFGFDAGMSDIFTTLTSGSTLYIIDEEMRLDLKRMSEYLSENHIDVSFFTTQVGRQMVTDYLNPYWKQVWTGGEKLVPLDPPKGFTLSNAYGPTECTVFMSIEDVEKNEYRVPIGKPIAISEAYIVDKSFREVPIGVPGELCIGGPQVARGYLHRDEETEAHFVPNPFSKEKLVSRLYRTGDVVRYLPNGKLDIIGRKDSQVKIRGFRIELSEVEGVIRNFKGIKDCTVVALPDPNGGSYLASYIVADDKIDIEALKAFIGKGKPPYMVPPAIMQIDQIPLNQNGKVNKRALPHIKMAREDVVLPRNDREKAIYQATKAVLGDTGFGIKEDLFAYGLSSIGLMKFLTLLEEGLGEDFSAREIREAKTIEAIASINHGKEEAVEEKLADYPLTKTQEGVYVESMSNLGSTIYNVPLLQMLDPSIDVKKLAAALKAAIDNHPYLKSQLVVSGSGEPRMKPVNEEAVVDIEMTHDQVPSFHLKPFDLFKDRLYRIKIVQAWNGNFLFLEIHHLVFDGASLAVFYQDAECAYLGKPMKKETKDGYAIAIEEGKRRTIDELAKEKSYYESFLKGIDASSTPKKECSGNNAPKAGSYDHPLELPNGLDGFLKENGLTRNGFYNAAFAFTLSRWNDMDESLYTTIYEGRDLASYSRSVSMLVKTIPVHSLIKDGETVMGFLKAIGSQIAESQANTLYSFAELAHDLAVPSDILFAYQGDGFIPSTFAGKHVENLPLENDTPKSSFGAQIVESGSGSLIHFEYDVSLYKEEMPIHFGRMMEQVMKEFLTRTLLNEIESCDRKSREEIDSHNQTDDPPMYRNYPEIFQVSLRKNPDKDAVIAIDETITYRELDRRSSAVANFLIKKGAKKDDKIVVMMPRIANAYSVIQGVLKAGSCFAPVDPKYPDDRVNYIIENAEAPFVVTTEKIKEERVKTLAKVPVYTIEEILASDPDFRFPNVDIDPSSLAYCIFTSGSTGKPKGVMIEHHSLVNYVSPTPHNLVTEEYIQYGHISLALASLSFDISVDEEMVPLANGLSVMLASEDEILNPILLAKRMKEVGVDFAFPVPSYLNNALDVKEVAEAFKDVKCIKAGGEAFTPSLYRKIKGLGITAALHNVYGPTEITIANCRDTLTDEDSISIGYPSANYRDYIIDKDNHPVPFGAIGEILVAGEGVSRGYVGRDDLNKVKYIEIDGKRAFKTGDVGRFLYDGRIDIFGRKDNQVKLRGLRVELDEIEANMEKFPGIGKAICLVKETPKDGQFLVGYYTSEANIDIEELKRHLAKTLTPYMIPRVFMKMDMFPTNNNGKVDKKALPTPEMKASSKTSKRKPKNELQTKLYEIFKKVLGNDDFSIDDDFFELGGSSLSASKVAMLAMEDNLPISYSDVFDNPTVADLYDHIILLDKDDKPKEEKEEPAEAIQSVPAALAHNDDSYLNDMRIDHDLGPVVLFGATGFLGMHVLRELLRDEHQKVICLVRPGKDIDVKDRVRGLLAYYFDTTFDSCFKSQLKVISGDLTDEGLAASLKDERFSTIINCAALVKHFANDDSIERVNFHGVENLISLALSRKCRFVQVSTLSVAGANVDGKFPPSKRIHENEIFFGQDLSNKYVHSKIMAEQAIEKAIEHDGLRAKIVRVGNLMSRQSDGEFQINSVTNNFMNSLKAYSALGAFPVSEADLTVDFSPIDEVAKTILLFAKTPDEFTIFHSANSHEVEMGDVINAMNECGFAVKLVDDTTFDQLLHNEMAKGSEKVASLIRYGVSKGSSVFILSDNSFSIKALYRLGFRWPLTSDSYLKRSIEALKSIGFFEE